jgi:hypothetical protein
MKNKYISDNVTWITFSLSYLSGRYTEKQQYPIYGISDLLSDFGGYLGLLLGHSILDVFDIGQLALKRCSR